MSMPSQTHNHNQSGPKLAVPGKACDTHIHVFGLQDIYPLAPTAQSVPPLAPAEDYRAVQQRLGLKRVVVVQPSAYGFDNRCTLDAMKYFGDDARGVVVIDPNATDAELQTLTDAGVRGVRFFMFPGGVLSWDAMDKLSVRVREFGWHVQLQLDGRDLPQHIEQLNRMPGKLVIDHTGKFIEPVSTGDQAFKTLLDIVDGGRCWIKLSAPYETSKVGPPHYNDVGNLARVLAKAAPERMLWASNWPHPSALDNLPDDAMLLDLLLDWVDDDVSRKQILVDNPAELYGF